MNPLDQLRKFIGPPEPVLPFLFRVYALTYLPVLWYASVLKKLGYTTPDVDPAEQMKFSWRFTSYFITPWLIPWFETLIMVLVIAGLRRVRVRGEWLVWSSAVIWAGFHWNRHAWFHMGTGFWTFLVYTVVFLMIEPKGRDRALCQISIAHTLHNLTALMVALAWGK